MTASMDQDELDLRGYVAVAMRRKWTIVATTVVTMVVAVGLTFLQTPMYRASSEVLIDTDSPQQLFDPTTGQRTDPSRAMQNEVEFIQSDLVDQKAEDELGYPASVTVSTQDDADILTITATETSAQKAADVANTYAQVYLDQRRARSVADYQATADAVQTNLTATQNAIAEAQARLDLVRLGDPNRTPEDLAQEEAELTARLSALDTEQTSLQDTLRQLTLTGQLVRDGSATITSEATPPAGPYSPKPVRNALLGLVLGLMLGVGLAFLREYLDDSVRSREDQEAATGGLPVLGVVPHVVTWRDTETPYLVAREEPTAAITEAYRTLRTSVQFLGVDRPLSSICVTSTKSGEGKTTTVANLAVVLANAGQHVLAVDCDLRRPRLHQFFGVSNATGFTTAILNETVAGAVQDVEGVDNLWVMPSGGIPPNPAEFLSSAACAQLLEALTASYDIVLIDTAPTLPVTDALILSRYVDVMLVVGKSGVTSTRDLTRTVELLTQVQAPLVGSVFNDVGSESGYGYRYRYRGGYGGYGYGPRAEDTNGRGSEPVGAPSAPDWADSTSVDIPAHPAPG